MVYFIRKYQCAFESCFTILCGETEVLTHDYYCLLHWNLKWLIYTFVRCWSHASMKLLYPLDFLNRGMFLSIFKCCDPKISMQVEWAGDCQAIILAILSYICYIGDASVFLASAIMSLAIFIVAHVFNLAELHLSWEFAYYVTNDTTDLFFIIQIM